MKASGLSARPDLDRDESPMAMFLEGTGASVRYVDIHSNRSLGAFIANALDDLPDGSYIRIYVTGG
jgi:hypothetical protein